MDHFFNVTLLSHETADSFLLSIGNGKCETHILIDGGLSKDTKKLIPYIKSLKESGRSLDLVIVTHVDKDHIGGVLNLFRDDLITKDFVKEVWFNGKSANVPSHWPDSLKVGFEQGNKLSKLLCNKKIAYRSVSADVRPQFINKVCKIRVLGPSWTALEQVYKDWKEHDSLKVGAEIPDHDVPWNEFDIDEFVEDKSSKNRSSIVVSIEEILTGKTAIFSGDSVPSEILEYVPFPRNIELFKIPHHGSKFNTNKALIERIRAKRYIIPAGADSKKPHKKMLHTLLFNGNRECELYVPESNWSVQAIQESTKANSCNVVEYSTGYKIKL